MIKNIFKFAGLLCLSILICLGSFFIPNVSASALNTASTTYQSIETYNNEFLPLISGDYGTFWTDGINLYTSDSYKFDFSTMSFTAVSIRNMPTQFTANCVWSDGIDTYYSKGTTQLKFNSSTLTWVSMSWGNANNFSGNRIWSNGVNYYCSNGTTQRVLDVSSHTWTNITWAGIDSFYGDYVWTDGLNMYYSNQGNQYLIDVENRFFSSITFNGVTRFSGQDIWTDGTYYYLSQDNESGYTDSYKFDVLTRSWSEISFDLSKTGVSDFYGYAVTNFKYYIIIHLLDWSTSSINYIYSYMGISNYYYNVGYNAGYNAGYIGGSSGDIAQAYNNGYNAGFTAGLNETQSTYYNNGYNVGYNAGYTAGIQDNQQNVYQNGYNAGYDNGFDIGKTEGITSANDYSFLGLIGAVVDAPLNAFKSLFNFNILGVNLLDFIFGILTLIITIYIIKLVRGG